MRLLRTLARIGGLVGVGAAGIIIAAFAVFPLEGWVGLTIPLLGLVGALVVGLLVARQALKDGARRTYTPTGAGFVAGALVGAFVLAGGLVGTWIYASAYTSQPSYVQAQQTAIAQATAEQRAIDATGVPTATLEPGQAPPEPVGSSPDLSVEFSYSLTIVFGIFTGLVGACVAAGTAGAGTALGTRRRVRLA